uniref:Uncharacterized protein n=1 Tax=Equus caballus TaxID=9796 RepID=A0A3Q2IL05_HORSE
MTPCPSPVLQLPVAPPTLSSSSCFPLPLPAVSLGLPPSPHLSHCPLFSVSQTLGSPAGIPRSEGCCLSPTRKGAGRDSEAVACLARRKCLCCGLVTPAPRTCRAAAAPGLARVNTAAGSPGYLYRGPGAGPVPTTAPALPCPPQPALSQRGTSRQGDAPQTQPPLSTEATRHVARDASGFTGDTVPPRPPGTPAQNTDLHHSCS